MREGERGERAGEGGEGGRERREREREKGEQYCKVENCYLREFHLETTTFDLRL